MKRSIGQQLDDCTLRVDKLTSLLENSNLELRKEILQRQRWEALARSRGVTIEGL